MKYFKTKSSLFTLTLMLLTTAFYSCQKDGEVVKKPVIKITAADSIKAYPGINRMVLSWEVRIPR